MTPSQPAALHVVFDGQCLFCRRALAPFRAFDRRGIEFHDATARAKVNERFPSLASENLDDAMFVVEPDGQLHRGFFAFRRLILSTPIAWPLLLLFYFPGATVVGPRVYAWVARHRRQLGCTSAVCELPPAKR